MSNSSGNSSGLKAHQEESQRQTRRDLELALARLRNGNPRRAKRGASITASSVAKEAGIERSTLYRYHEPILTEIRKLNDATPTKQLKIKRGELAEALSRTQEYREALEEARVEMTEWAKQNYALSHRVQELEESLLRRDAMISDLQKKLGTTEKIVPLTPVYSGCS
jgi:chromosome segregation ATPase